MRLNELKSSNEKIKKEKEYVEVLVLEKVRLVEEE